MIRHASVPPADREATLDDLAQETGKAELVHGRIVRMSPSGALPGYAAMKIALSLDDHTRRSGRGMAFTDNVGFLAKLPHRRTFSPDAAYFVGPIGMGYVDGPPLFAAEVRSEGDYGPAAERQLADKRADYFAAGTLVVWDVDLLGPDVIRAFQSTAANSPLIFRRGELAHAEPAVPGWSFPVDQLFPPAPEKST